MIVVVITILLILIRVYIPVPRQQQISKQDSTAVHRQIKSRLQQENSKRCFLGGPCADVTNGKRFIESVRIDLTFSSVCEEAASLNGV
jgi:hypothetical protein